MRLCAVIPAAGRGTRLGADLPKILVPVSPDATIWSVLKAKLRPLVDHIHVVLSPAGLPAFAAALEDDRDRDRVSTSVQPEPIGMGDAIFRGLPVWGEAGAIIVVWGDQVHVSEATLEASIDLHGGAPRTIVLPLAAQPEPYVEYRFDPQGRLDRILQSREGDRCAPGGLSDVGTFVLSTGELAQAWARYLAGDQRGAKTGEVNFLPFLVFLSQAGWTVRRHLVADPAEARGINTPEDLEFFRNLYRRRADAVDHRP